MRYGVQINLNAIEQSTLWQIIDHDHDNKGESFPSETRIAKFVGVSDRYIREIIGQLERKKKIITVKRKFGHPNKYKWEMLKKKLQPFWEGEHILTQEPQFRIPRNPSSGESGTTVPGYPGTPVPPNTIRLYEYAYGNAMKKTLKKLLEPKLENPKKVVEYLREIAANGSEGKEAAGITLMMLEQLWKWGFQKELMDSWKWFFYASITWPNVVQRAWAEVKDRKTRGENMKKPGAILTLRIKELANGNQ